MKLYRKQERKKEELKSIQGLFWKGWKEMKTYEIKRETDEIKKCGEKIRLKDLV